MFLTSSGGVLTGNTISGSDAGVGAFSGSYPSSGGSGQDGNNLITGNNSGLVSENTGTVIHFGSYAGRNLYQGTCNQVYGNTSYDAYADGGGDIIAEYDWWGQYPPDASKFYIGSGSSINYSNALTSPGACPNGGASPA